MSHKRALIVLSQPNLTRQVMATWEKAGGRSQVCHTAIEAVHELFTRTFHWIVLDFDLFERASRPQLLIGDLWTLNRQTPVVIVTSENHTEIKRFLSAAPMRVQLLLTPATALNQLPMLAQEIMGTRPGHSLPPPPAALTELPRPEKSSMGELPRPPRPSSAGELPRPQHTPATGALPRPEGTPAGAARSSDAAKKGAPKVATLSISIEERRRIEVKLQLLDEGDLFKILEIAPTATDRQVKSGYFQLVKQFHPDRYYGRVDEEWDRLVTRLFRGITRAYESLLDPAERARYQSTYKPGEVFKPVVSAATPAEAEPSAKPKPVHHEAEETPLTKEELDAFLRREAEWKQNREFQAWGKAQDLFDKASEVLNHPDPDSLPLAPLREAYKSVTEAISLMPEQEEFLSAHQRIRGLYERKRAYYHYRRGLDRLASGDRLDGYQDLKDAVTFDPKSEYLAALVKAMLDNSWDLARAELLCQSLVDEDPNNADYRLFLGRIVGGLGRFKEALLHLRTAVRMGRKNEAFRWIEFFEQAMGAQRSRS